MNSCSTILWLTGWSIDDDVFNPLRDQLRSRLPEWRHSVAHYYDAKTPEQMHVIAKVAAHACRQASDGPLLIAGWSLGGLLALRLAGELGAEGLVLLGSTARFIRPRGETDLGWPDAYLRQMSSALKHDRAAVEWNFHKNLFTPRELERGIHEMLPAAGRWPNQALLAGLELLRHEDCRPLLPGIACPVLVVHGQDDIVCPFGAAKELHKSLPRASLLAVEDGGHAPFLGRETEVADAIRSWWYER
ncbi:alpha/beta fold hydrolase [Brevibacillus sp. AY1]|uniref:alpha/beta fold hydrolase n=1 Tax=Brevibacillus sp. AY1 TaxID=2807621 RepID=UPI002454C68F|nr:alpha/beta fold hydrolase [Brevibacillus sp. AY1]MDH4619515.1 alpha/beta fold hydrolase [Brevibacillus sp. AY1]